jgi:hypothetical protein
VNLRAAAERARPLARRAKARYRAADLATRLAYLRERNKRSSRPIVGDAPVAVSLTTHGRRIQNVFYALESIARSQTKPRRVVLWLDDPSAAADLPESLVRLQRRGLEIGLSSNYGPHTKYYPYVAEQSQHAIPLVTADDDVLYARDWLDALMGAEPAPGEVVCHRARRIELVDDAIAPYAQWGFVTDTRLTGRNFATGVGGVRYPVPLLDALHAAGEEFQSCCPKADDVWLHAIALRNGYRARQLTAIAQERPYVPFGKDVSLWPTNVTQGGNDAAVAATYTDEDVRILRSEP